MDACISKCPYLLKQVISKKRKECIARNYKKGKSKKEFQISFCTLNVDEGLRIRRRNSLNVLQGRK